MVIGLSGHNNMRHSWRLLLSRQVFLRLPLLILEVCGVRGTA